MPKPIYLDHAAATPLDPAVLQAMQPFWQEQFYNPSATYLPAQTVKQALEQARADIAKVLGARGPEIIFTAGGTESCNLAVHGIMQQYPGANVVVSGVEHEAVLAPAQQYAHQLAPVGPDGIVVLEKLQKAINDQTVLVSVMYANNEVGSLQPIAKIGQLIKRLNLERQQKNNPLPLYFHTDACQAAAYLDLNVARLGVDLMTLNGGKIYGPKQSGILYVKGGLKLQPQINGGGQEYNLRSGTENVAACVGFAKALQLVQTKRHQEGKRLQTIQQDFLQQLPEVWRLNGSNSQRLPNNLHITFPGADNERLLIQLEMAGILAAAGSACSAQKGVPSHVLKAMGLSDQDAQASLRFTMGKTTTGVELTKLLKTLVKLLS
ncbi:MAG TPA: cysteine desulfurase family protein [Candidatus Saccharibacteria bacterium]|nr:cysteine desulfurase family protein [Candidatus Saccharibacteria bacterium]